MRLRLCWCCAPRSILLDTEDYEIDPLKEPLLVEINTEDHQALKMFDWPKENRHYRDLFFQGLKVSLVEDAIHVQIHGPIFFAAGADTLAYETYWSMAFRAITDWHKGKPMVPVVLYPHHLKNRKDLSDHERTEWSDQFFLHNGNSKQPMICLQPDTFQCIERLIIASELLDFGVTYRVPFAFHDLVQVWSL